MAWYDTAFWKKPESEIIKKETVVIDMMKDDVDPTELTIENAYKTRWIWYHTILAIEIFTTNMLLLAILVTLAIKL
jgi:hypothetical protein